MDNHYFKIKKKEFPKWSSTSVYPPVASRRIKKKKKESHRYDWIQTNSPPPIPLKSASQLIKSQLNIPPPRSPAFTLQKPNPGATEGSSVSALPWNSRLSTQRISVRLLGDTRVTSRTRLRASVMYKRGEGRVSKREEEIRQRFVNEKLVKRGRERERERQASVSRDRQLPAETAIGIAREREREREREKRPAGRRRGRSGGWSTERGEGGTERADRGSWRRDEDETRQAKERGCALEREVWREGERDDNRKSMRARYR